MLPLSSARYKACCRDGDLVAVTSVDVGLSSRELNDSLGLNNRLAGMGWVITTSLVC